MMSELVDLLPRGVRNLPGHRPIVFQSSSMETLHEMKP